MFHVDGFKGLIIFLVVAGVVVPLFHHARLGTVLGFLVVGAVLGPHGLGRLVPEHPWLFYVTFDNPERGHVLAELGIIFLLFLIGLEVSIERLWQLRRYVFGLGAVQVLVSALALAVLVRWAGAKPPSGILLGMCLALSSTAAVMQLLVEQRRAVSQVGHVALSVLLFQDLMVIPLLFVVSVLSGGGQESVETLAIGFGEAALAVFVMWFAGRFLLGPLLRSAARTGSRELIMAITLLIVISFAGLTERAGMSLALGAFLAGLILSESEYRHHIEADIEPFKGLLLGIFFLTVGMTLDLNIVYEDFAIILAGVAVLIVVKTLVLYVAARGFRLTRAVSIELALLLAQAGEFAFVVIGLARKSNLLTEEVGGISVAVVAISILVTPGLAALARVAARRLETVDHAAHALGPDATALSEHVIIGGFGRVGRTVAQLLDGENVPFVALDASGARVEEQRKAGRNVYFGDASRGELLLRAGALNARAFVVTLDASGAAEHMIKAVLKLRPEARIFARARARRMPSGCASSAPWA